MDEPTQQGDKNTLPPCRDTIEMALAPLVEIYGEERIDFALQGWLADRMRRKAKESKNVMDGRCAPCPESGLKYDPLIAEPKAKG